MHDQDLKRQTPLQKLVNYETQSFLYAKSINK